MIIRGKRIIVKDAEYKRYNGGAHVMKRSGVGITVERTKAPFGLQFAVARRPSRRRTMTLYSNTTRLV